MIDPAASLAYYKRPAVQKAILECALNRDVWIKYGERNGKRPDVLLHERDVWEAAKQGASSFHISEERWSQPLDLLPGTPRRELDEMRLGWDFIIDVDCTTWEYSKRISSLIVQILRDEGVRSIGAKFSGNKGFHIVVPYEAFPETYKETPTARHFPEIPRALIRYLLEKLKIRFQDASKDDLTRITGLSVTELLSSRCTKCAKVLKKTNDEKTFEYLCERCGTHENAPDAGTIKPCSKPGCGYRFMKRMGPSLSRVCPECKGTRFEDFIDLSSIINLDEGLISSRHMLRCAYSMHEKSGLVSLPIPPDSIVSFEREAANPANLPGELMSFIPTDAKKNDAAAFFERAMDHRTKEYEKEEYRKTFTGIAPKGEYREITAPLPEGAFPPCIKLTLQGIKDGKKRAAFYLINFLSSVGWSAEEIEKRLLAWNELNYPPLRAGYLQSQARSLKHQDKKILPPNCDNKAYYVDIGVCKPDSLCATIRNPANYAIKRARRLAENQPKERAPRASAKKTKKTVSTNETKTA